MYISQLSLGFIEVYNRITLNIYTVGCKRNCEGCSNKIYQDFNYPNRYSIDSEYLIDKIKHFNPLVDGICWLGGDALYQSEDLIKISKDVYCYDKHLINCLYTGEYFENISNDIKQYTNIIVDGPWEGKTIQDKDTNQRIFIKNIDWEQVSYKDFIKIMENDK